MERTEQGDANENGDLRDAEDLESEKKHEKKLEKTCFCGSSTPQVEKTFFSVFSIFSNFQVLRMMLNCALLGPG